MNGIIHTIHVICELADDDHDCRGYIKEEKKKNKKLNPSFSSE